MPETNFFWDPLSDNILQERDEIGAVTAEYTTEPGLYGNLISQSRQGVESQYHFDALGSTLALTDDSQQVTDNYAYSAFGEVTEHTGSTDNPFQYVGQKGYYKDELAGTSFVRRRPFVALDGRWLAIDPFQDDYNRYRYVKNQPLLLIDPSGLFWLCLCPLCDCGSLLTKELGWRIFLFPASGGKNSALVLSYVWLASATTGGDTNCLINTGVRGTIVTTRDGVESTLRPSLDRRLLSDGRCALPLVWSKKNNNLNCKSEFNGQVCKGKICYCDAPGDIIEGFSVGIWDVPFWWGFTRPKVRMCVTLDLTFDIRCRGGIPLWELSKELKIQSTACVTFDSQGNMNDLIAEGRHHRPVAMEVTTADIANECP